jgi:hypothetical protein
MWVSWGWLGEWGGGVVYITRGEAFERVEDVGGH